MVPIKVHPQNLRLRLLFSKRKAVSYICDALGVTRTKITSCKPTGKGFSNRSFCVIVGYKSAYHVRLAKSDFPIDRKTERKIMESVGFSFVDFNEINGDYIRPWLNGTAPRQWNEVLLRNLATCLKSLHSLTPPENAPIFNPWFYDSMKDLPAKYSTKYRELVTRHRDKSFVLCHNDVHKANIVLQQNDKLALIDYEWACLNSPLWELGNFIREERLTPVQIGVLANEYGLGVSVKDLRDFVFMAACYGWLWARCMPFSLKILKQRRKTVQDLKDAFLALKIVF